MELLEVSSAATATAAVEWIEPHWSQDLPFANECDIVVAELFECEKRRRSLAPGLVSLRRIGRIDGKIETRSFADAAEEGVLCIIDALLSGMIPAHGMVRHDTRSTVGKLLDRCQEMDVVTLQDLVLREIETGRDYRESGREALLWFKRTLQFISLSVHAFLQSDEDEPLSSIVKGCYNRTLAPVHGFKAHAFRIFLNGVAKRQVFIGRLGSDTRQVKEDLRKCVRSLDPIVEEIVALMDLHALEHCKKMQHEEFARNLALIVSK